MGLMCAMVFLSHIDFGRFVYTFICCCGEYYNICAEKYIVMPGDGLSLL